MCQTLKNCSVTEKLDSLLDIAEKSSSINYRGRPYSKLTDIFVDGFAIYIGDTPRHTLSGNLNSLKSLMNGRLQNMIVMNLLPSQQREGTTIWVTVTPSTTVLTPFTMTELAQCANATRLHSKTFWGKSEGDVEEIRLSKLDLASDLRGGFLPSDTWQAYNKIKEKISYVLPDVLGSSMTNFVSCKPLNDIRVLNGKNCLASCFQYDVRDLEGDSLMTVKVYDKILDLVGREHQYSIGSRINEVIGSKRLLNPLNRRVCQAQDNGVTRLEVSLKQAVFQKYAPHEPSRKTLWHQRA